MNLVYGPGDQVNLTLADFLSTNGVSVNGQTQDLMSLVNVDNASVVVAGSQKADTLSQSDFDTSTTEAYLRAGDDVLTLDQAADGLQIFGGEGNDSLVIANASGDVRFDGGEGSDRIVFGQGSQPGQVVNFNMNTQPTDQEDVLVLDSAFSADDLSFEINDFDLSIRLNSNNAQLNLQGFFVDLEANRLRTIEFADGTQWDTNELLLYLKASTGFIFGSDEGEYLVGNETNNYIMGLGGSDTIDGNGGNDTLIGGTGNDQLAGGAGDDIYLFNRGDGYDTIVDFNTNASTKNVIAFGEGISLGDLSFSKSISGLDLIIKVEGGSGAAQDGMEILNFYSSTYATHGHFIIEQLRFADGTILSHSDLVNLFPAPTTEGNDWIFGTDGDDVIDAGAGFDIIQESSGNDTYIYNTGDGHNTFFGPYSANEDLFLRRSFGVRFVRLYKPWGCLHSLTLAQTSKSSWCHLRSKLKPSLTTVQ